jgi:hypothetical protein
VWGAPIPSYTQIFEGYDDGTTPVDIIVDSSGLKVYNRGEWMRQKWGVRRGFVKMHVTCDRKTHRITSVEITDSTWQIRSSSPSCRRQGEGRERGRVFGDTAYDSANFNVVGSIVAEPVIKPRANSSGKSMGSYLRGKTAKEFIEDPRPGRRGTGTTRDGRLRPRYRP